MKFKVAVDVLPKQGISDPQGQTIERALPGQGFEGVTEVRVGKRIEFFVEAEDSSTAQEMVNDMCSRFLSNPIIEDFRFSVEAPERVN